MPDLIESEPLRRGERRIPARDPVAWVVRPRAIALQANVVALECRAARAYSLLMDDTPNRTPPADWDPPTPSEAELLAALAESEAEAEAGLFVPGETVRRELLDSIARLEARAAGRKAKAAGRRC